MFKENIKLCGGSKGKSFHYTPCQFLFLFFHLCRAPHRPLIADLNVCEEDSVAKLCTLTEGTHESKKAAGPRWKVGLLQLFSSDAKC